MVQVNPTFQGVHCNISSSFPSSCSDLSKPPFRKPSLATHCLSTTCSLDLGANLHHPFTLASFMIGEKKVPCRQSWQLLLTAWDVTWALWKSCKRPCVFFWEMPKCFPTRGGSLQQYSQSSSCLVPSSEYTFSQAKYFKWGGLTLKEPFPLFQSRARHFFLKVLICNNYRSFKHVHVSFFTKILSFHIFLL